MVELLFAGMIITIVCVSTASINALYFSGKLTPLMPVLGMVTGYAVGKLTAFLF